MVVKTETKMWGPGGVAFISPQEDKAVTTLCRIWKITQKQFNEVKSQEGSWYEELIKIGDDSGIPIYTITHKERLNNILRPSDSYLNTIIIGLQETHRLSNEEIANYLIEIEGVKDNITKEEILRMVDKVEAEK